MVDKLADKESQCWLNVSSTVDAEEFGYNF